jgi:hypothetical protein
MVDSRRDRLVRTAQGSVVRLEYGRRTGLVVAAARRFFAIDGVTWGGLMSIELFTTVLPLVILGFSYFSEFADNASLGDVIVNQLKLRGITAQTVRATFGTSDALRSSWTVIGLAAWLLWGVLMAITVGSLFAKAWRREPFALAQRVWRGVLWFLVYLATLLIREQILIAISQGSPWHLCLYVVALVPDYLFWTVTPVFLVRDRPRGKRILLTAGLAGMLIDGVIVSAATSLVLPQLLVRWTSFGPIGVALAAMSWCLVVGYGWVATACFSAVLAERTAPIPAVAEAESET